MTEARNEAVVGLFLCADGGDGDVADKEGRVENLKPVLTKEEARERGRNGGKKSAEVRRAKKNMREMAKFLMESEVSGKLENVRRAMGNMGIDKDDMTYQGAVVVSVLNKAMNGDTQAVRLLGEMTGDLKQGGFGYYGDYQQDDPNVIDMQYPVLCLPDNGRDIRRKDLLRPQAGPQTQFMASEADIVIYGGAAGGGKTYALLMEALRHKDVRGFDAAIFRKNFTQITNPGGLWDASNKLYSMVPDAESRKTPKLGWVFAGGGKLTFAHIGSEDDLKSWQGSEIAYIGFDELTHFTRHQFLYMYSRNRSTCGVKPYIRATCNPDADSWVAEFISWWINQETGYPIKERSGQIRWMVVLSDIIYWADTVEELVEKYEVDEGDCKSVTFIASKLTDNKVLMETNPGYLANLKAMTEVDMERLLKGNWKIKPAAGMFFKRSQVDVIEELPKDIIAWARGWDLAATPEDDNGDPAYTASVLIGKTREGRYIVADVTNQRLSAADVRKQIKNTCTIDKKKYKHVTERLPQDPGQAGKAQKESFIKYLSGFVVKIIPESGSKETRAEPFAVQWQNGNVSLLLAEWNEMYLTQLESFPESKFKDMVDASSSAFDQIEGAAKVTAPSGTISKESYWKS